MPQKKVPDGTAPDTNKAHAPPAAFLAAFDTEAEEVRSLSTERCPASPAIAQVRTKALSFCCAFTDFL
eukprot:SAG22_NODE_142_length_17922_cov_10.990406_16_plen_68_part_00